MQDDNKTQIFELQAYFCRSLADPKRLMMIHELREGEKSVGELSQILGLKQSNTSQHIAVLRKAGILFPRKAGNVTYYSLVNPHIAEACDLVREVISSQLERSGVLAKELRSI
jgi:DNA-binding transcriptional ArsR family regulator